MPITTKDRYFGEGIDQSGASTAKNALDQHREHVRSQRLNDLLVKDFKLDLYNLLRKIDQINLAIKAADDQVDQDNADFIHHHNLGRVL